MKNGLLAQARTFFIVCHDFSMVAVAALGDRSGMAREAPLGTPGQARSAWGRSKNFPGAENAEPGLSK